MPEGDTVHKLASALRPALEGRALERLWLRDRGEVRALAGRRVCEVATLGKHLLIGIAAARDARAGHAAHLETRVPARSGSRAEWVLHVHLGMHGRWERAHPGGPWRWPRHRASLALRADGREHVCFRAAVAELVQRRDLSAHPQLSRLGPDLLAPPVPFARVVARARRRAPRAAAELLLDQRVACGAGNAIKNEALFWEGIHPRTRTDALEDAAIERLFRRAAELLAWNLGGGRRTTTRRVTPERPLGPAEPRAWVQDRAGRPCLRCGARIAVARVGDAARPTWWCPRCQPLPASLPASSGPSAPPGKPPEPPAPDQ